MQTKGESRNEENSSYDYSSDSHPTNQYDGKGSNASR